MKRFIECLVPDSFCNFSCSYCYVQQQNRKKKIRQYPSYTPEHIAQALRPERLGGVSFINITGLGETLIEEQVVQIVHEILKTGNYVNITTNGTLSKRILQLVDFDHKLLKHLHFAFSCHIVELKRHNMVDRFFQNIKTIQNAGCSFVMQINLVDEYDEYWNEIKELSIRHLGALPQVALTRKENGQNYSIFTNHSIYEYTTKAREMQSPLFEWTLNNFNKRQKGYCYAGSWSTTLNIYTGEMTGCYGQGINQNIFEDLNKPIIFKPIGYCYATYCVNSSHFLSLGTIPSYTPQKSYAELRNRESANWYSVDMKSFLSKQLSNENKRIIYESLHIRTIPVVLRLKEFLHKTKLILSHILKKR